MRFLIALFAVAFVISTAAASDVRVVDGDTIKIDDVSYRIEGIDAPEAGQRCSDGKGGTWRCGQAATVAMAALVESAEVRCDALSDDGMGRMVANCFADAASVGVHMVRRGLAWAFVKYSDTYIAEERLARSEGIGIWRAETLPAWEYREQRWAVAEQKAPDGCPIKGNISSNGRIYHAPWSPWYDRTRVSIENGERWFCIEAEALAAGWRAPLWH